jgi:hypothetical protein
MNQLIQKLTPMNQSIPILSKVRISVWLPTSKVQAVQDAKTFSARTKANELTWEHFRSVGNIIICDDYFPVYSLLPGHNFMGNSKPNYFTTVFFTLNRSVIYDTFGILKSDGLLKAVGKYPKKWLIVCNTPPCHSKQHTVASSITHTYMAYRLLQLCESSLGMFDPTQLDPESCTPMNFIAAIKQAKQRELALCPESANLS